MPAEGVDGISVTIKRRESERYAGDGTWIVFHGSARQIKRNIVEMFELDESEALPALIAQAERIHKTTNPMAIQSRPKPQPTVADVHERLTGEPTPEQAVENVVKGLDGEVVDDDPWKSARSAPEPDQGLGEVKDELLEAIEKAESKTALRNLHSQNVELFKEDKYKDALRARAKEVS